MHIQEAATENHIPKYSQGGGSYTVRPPTGVDLALGLSGFHDKLSDVGPQERPPTTLQPLKGNMIKIDLLKPKTSKKKNRNNFSKTFFSKSKNIELE